LNGHGVGYRAGTYTHTYTHTRTHHARTHIHTHRTQVAVADLIGMVLGIELARQAGTQPLYIWGAYIVLSLLDFFFIFKVMRACADALMLTCGLDWNYTN